MQGLVILDRDGVINEDSDAYIRSLEEWHPYPFAFHAIARLNHAGWRVAVATNQSGIGRGYYTEDTLSAIHAVMRDKTKRAGGEITQILHCPHRPNEQCECRKPRPGMLQRLRQDLELPGMKESWMVGDSLRDIQAGIAAGCRTALVETGKGLRYVDEVKRTFPETWICRDLDDFVSRLIGTSAPKE